MKQPFWHVTQLTDEAAEKHTRFAYNVPPESRLGWKPYNYLVTCDSVSYWAAYTEKEFIQRMQQHGLDYMNIDWTPWSNGVRSAVLRVRQTQEV